MAGDAVPGPPVEPPESDVGRIGEINVLRETSYVVDITALRWLNKWQQR